VNGKALWVTGRSVGTEQGCAAGSCRYSGATAKDNGLFIVFRHLGEDADNEYAMIDATVVCAHQHSAGAKRGLKPVRRSVVSQRRIDHQAPCEL
jgi:hypothetical protein